MKNAITVVKLGFVSLKKLSNIHFVRELVKVACNGFS